MPIQDSVHQEHESRIRELEDKLERLDQLIANTLAGRAGDSQFQVIHSRHEGLREVVKVIAKYLSKIQLTPEEEETVRKFLE